MSVKSTSSAVTVVELKPPPEQSRDTAENTANEPTTAGTQRNPYTFILATSCNLYKIFNPEFEAIVVGSGPATDEEPTLTRILDIATDEYNSVLSEWNTGLSNPVDFFNKRIHGSDWRSEVGINPGDRWLVVTTAGDELLPREAMNELALFMHNDRQGSCSLVSEPGSWAWRKLTHEEEAARTAALEKEGAMREKRKDFIETSKKESGKWEKWLEKNRK